MQVRLKAEPAVREAAAWYCDCGALVANTEIAAGVVQDGYLAAVKAFNAGARACPACGRVHPPAELGDIAWASSRSPPASTWIRACKITNAGLHVAFHIAGNGAAEPRVPCRACTAPDQPLAGGKPRPPAAAAAVNAIMHGTEASNCA